MKDLNNYALNELSTKQNQQQKQLTILISIVGVLVLLQIFDLLVSNKLNKSIWNTYFCTKTYQSQIHNVQISKYGETVLQN